MTDNIRIDIIGVGAPKCGTTWLASCLGEHPEVCLSDPSTLNYFCREMIWPEFQPPSVLGWDWLADRFRHCRPGQRLLEISPNYLYDKESPKRIFQHNPDCRLIFTFRHPIELISSFYYQIAKESPVPKTLEGFLEKYPEVRRIGLYHHYLQAFLEVFPRAQCFFLVFDDIAQDPQAVLRRCFSFLGVAPDFVPPSLNRRVNERSVPRSQAIRAVINGLRHFLRRYTSPKVWQALIWNTKLYRLHDWILQRNLKPFTSLSLQEPTRAQLLDFYREDTAALAEFLGRDLSAWQR